MRFGAVLGRSLYGSTGFLADTEDLGALERVIVHNLPVLRRFRHVVVATNYADPGDEALRAANQRVWRHHLPDCVLIDSTRNRGHSIGTADLDNMVFDHCRRSGVEWLCKGANDVAIDPRVQDIVVEPADFYYLNAVSFAALRERNFDLSLFTGEYLYPQTTFYAIRVPAVDHLVDEDFLDRSWAAVQRIPGYNGRIWEYIPGWSCELLLRQTVLRNHLSRHPLMSDQQWQRVLHVVIDERIEDCSFKGISINGICHAQGLDDPGRPWLVID